MIMSMCLGSHVTKHATAGGDCEVEIVKKILFFETLLPQHHESKTTIGPSQCSCCDCDLNISLRSLFGILGTENCVLS